MVGLFFLSAAVGILLDFVGLDKYSYSIEKIFSHGKSRK